MKIKTNLITGLLLFSAIAGNAQTPVTRELPAKRTTQAVKIDGLLNDSAWKDAAMMTDMVEFRPTVGGLKTPKQKQLPTSCMMMKAFILVVFVMNEQKTVLQQNLIGRDGFGTNDYVGLIFDTYYDKLNGFEYFVTPLGEQWDAKMSPQSQWRYGRF